MNGKLTGRELSEAIKQATRAQPLHKCIEGTELATSVGASAKNTAIAPKLNTAGKPKEWQDWQVGEQREYRAGPGASLEIGDLGQGFLSLVAGR